MDGTVATLREPLELAPDGPSRAYSLGVARATWAFVGLGIALRICRYLMNYPLWWDEAFVGANLLRRGYLDLLRPLDFGQVCPLLFMWVELSVVKLLGFSETTLRLFPLACAVASVIVFRHAAGRVLRGVPLLLAVAIFAVAYHPIRHAADAKPYSSDLLVAVVLLALVLEWWRTPARTRWLWGLAAFGPIAIALSYPAAFVAGGLGVAIAPAVWRSRSASARVALGVFQAMTVGTFLFLFLIYTRAQAEVTLPGMSADWAGSFPPVSRPGALLHWLVSIHAGAMLAYPCGGERGASVLTLLAVVIAGSVLWRRGRRTVLAACLGPLGVALVAAAVRRYPYGGSARFMLYAAPAICLLTGLGAAAVWARILRATPRKRALGAGLLALAVIGIVPVAADLAHPYRSVPADRARKFARQFWPAVARDAEPACVLWDYGVGRWNTIHLHVAVYLCNQKIYCPSRRRGDGPRLAAVSTGRPLRCVLAENEDVPAAELAGWLESMQSRYQLRTRQRLVVNMAEPGAVPRLETYSVFEFVPKAEPNRMHARSHAPRGNVPS